MAMPRAKLSLRAVPYDLRVLARITQFSLAIQATVSALSAVNGYRVGVVAEDPASALIALMQFVTFATAAVFFLTWTYRAKANVRATGAKGLSFSPAMSVWSYFIPLINLVVPVQAMQELHKTSIETRDWEAVDSSGMIWLWWFFWIVGNIAGVVTFRLLTLDEGKEVADFAVRLSIASDIGTVLASLVLLRIVGTIAGRLMHLRDTAQFT